MRKFLVNVRLFLLVLKYLKCSLQSLLFKSILECDVKCAVRGVMGGCAIDEYDFLRKEETFKKAEIISSTRDHLNMISLEVGERSRFES